MIKCLYCDLTGVFEKTKTERWMSKTGDFSINRGVKGWLTRGKKCLKTANFGAKTADFGVKIKKMEVNGKKIA